ncbi:MAG: hypothetical protein ACFFE8_10755 [Candidatus Heimdallarchaeota archaeon]
MASSVWKSMTFEERIEVVRERRSNGETFAMIAESLIGSSKNKSTIWSWARRNMETHDLYPKMDKFPTEPYSRFTEVEQWTIYDIITALFPRLDAITQHLLIEIEQISKEQNQKFTTTAGFLDQLEQRVIQAIQQNIMASSGVQIPASSIRPTPPIPSPRRTVPPPPPSTSALPSAILPDHELRNDFEEMTLEEIAALPQSFLETLNTSERNRLQERVKELRMLSIMSLEERTAYLLKKQEERERVEATEGLGASLSEMLADSGSLFARMRRVADDSGVSGTGTFGKFLTEFNYFYCFACGTTNRVEGDSASTCISCHSGEELLVKDEEKSQFRYWECLSEKILEPVDSEYTRGAPISVKSRWKTLIGETAKTGACKDGDVREITPFVLIKENPDQQFAHYLTLFRLYLQLGLPNDLKSELETLLITIQQLPDITSKDHTSTLAIKIMTILTNVLNWLQSENIMKSIPDNQTIGMQVRNLLQDIDILQDPDSPQELPKASEIGQITGKVDQILNRFTQILGQLESMLLLSPRVS